ncbi:hypothetical protein [Yersinia ruckeri]|uniref:hypothetical protein n=1 Tax=Yersinia ruckeri TaxID=29486 RepID=UPI00223760C6|nr:hypothetical protein [Yersinia ruckeri]MCW6598749.1 hypothetical protein [Yersinia ruckeri]
MMKTFSSTKASQPGSGGFTNINDDYWKEVHTVHRASSLKAPIRMSIISFLRPMRTHSAEMLSGKSFPTACLAFNPENEEFDAGRCPWCEWEYGAACNYLVKVFVHNWFENPASNPAPEKGPIAILELTKGMIQDIATINETWALDPENGGICNPECGVVLSLSGAHKGGNPNAAIEYSIQGIPAKIQITPEWLNEGYASGAWFDWDLERYANSKVMRGSELIPWLVRNGYTYPKGHEEAMAWLDGLAENIMSRTDHVNNFAATEEEAEAWNSQLEDTDEGKRMTKFVYLGEKGIRSRAEKALVKYLGENQQDATGGYQQDNFNGQQAGSMGFGNQQAGGAPAPNPAPAPAPAPAASAPAARTAPAPAPAPAGGAPKAAAPAPAAAPKPAAAGAPKAAGAPAAAPKPAPAPAPAGGGAPSPLAAPKPAL